MRRTNPHLAGTKPINQCVSSGLFILPQEVEVKTSYSDSLSKCGRTKSGQGPLRAGEDFLCLLFLCFGERRRRLRLTLDGSCADFVGYAIHSHRAAGASSAFVNRSQFIWLVEPHAHAPKFSAYFTTALEQDLLRLGESAVKVVRGGSGRLHCPEISHYE